LEFDLRQLSVDEKAELSAWIALYKSLRPVLHQGRTWQGECGDGIVWQAYADAAPAAKANDNALKRCIVLVYRTQPTQLTFSPALRLPMLSKDAVYRVKRLDPQHAASFHHSGSAPVFDQIESGSLQCQGEWLAAMGMPLPRFKAEQAMVLEFTRA
jgi:alpha-galactosidase